MGKYFIFDHMLDLAFHGDEEEDAKVQDENWVINTNTSIATKCCDDTEHQRKKTMYTQNRWQLLLSPNAKI